MRKEMLKTPEAAVVAEVGLRDVHRMIDEGILPPQLHDRDGGRQVWAESCGLISFYVESAARLTAEERIGAIGWAAKRLTLNRPDADWTLREGFLSIDLGPFLRKAQRNLALLHAARALITHDPDILSGAAVIRGTRLSPYDLAASLDAGLAEAELLQDNPQINADMLTLARLYAEANPLRGRPRQAASAGRVVSDKLVTRRKPAA
jgi:uncharacterized protein (DUF433 family)